MRWPVVLLTVILLGAGCGRRPGMEVGDGDSGVWPDAAIPSSCGNGFCETDLGENAVNCRLDCGVVKLSATNNDTCAVRADGTVVCWGAILPDPPDPVACYETPELPAPWPALADVLTIDGGELHACEIATDRRVLCWGLNDDGQLGDGTTSDSREPVVVEGITDAVDVAAGLSHTCAVHASGAVSCWGSNSRAQLGLPEDDPQGSWTPVTMPYLEDVVHIAASRGKTCANTGAGQVLCWGGNACPDANGVFDDCHEPYLVPGLDDARAISTGYCFVCALRSTGTVVCLGSQSDEGQLGDGTRTDSVTPVVTVGLADVVSLSSGIHHTCAVTQSGEVWCWGKNEKGQLGVNEIIDSPVPVRVESLDGAVGEPATSNWHTCVALADGTVWCWGWNCYGQLGDGTPYQSVEPIIVRGI